MATKPKEWESVPGFDPVKGKYVPLNLDDWLREHKIVEDGKSRGAQNLPASDIESLDGPEVKIIAWVNQRGVNCRDSVAHYFSDVEQQLADMDKDEDLENAAREVQETRRAGGAELKKQADLQSNIIAPKAHDLCATYRDYQDFRQANSLTRPPDYSHRSKSPWVIGGLFILEVFANALFLAGVNPFGLLGSIGLMTLISGLNVLLAGMFFGFLWRLKNHVRRSRITIAVLGMLVLFVFVAAFNLLVGHFRESMQSVVNAPATEIFVLGDDALERLLTAPFALGSFNSMFMTVLGIVFFLYGGIKWFQRDDPYPEYGQKHRQLQAKEESYRKQYHQARSALDECLNQYRDRLWDVRHKLKVQKDRYLEKVRRCKGIAENYTTNLTQYQRDLDFLLGAWRTANRDARITPPPPHFAAIAKIDQEILVPPGFNPPEGNSLDTMEDLMKEVHEAVSHVQDEYTKLSTGFKRIDELMEDASSV